MTIEIQPSKAFSSELVSHLNRSVLSYDPVSDPIQWREGERLEHLLEERCRAFQQAGKSDHVALSFRDQSLTYEELNRRSNQLAHFLKRRGIQPGDRVGHLFQKTPETYVALFAALKAGATFLPLDVTIPEERLKFIIQDSELKALLTMSAFESQFGGLELETLYVDTLGDELSKEPEVSLYQSLPQEDSIAYIIYTSGTTGNPKGVAIQHSSICNFVRVAATAYGYREDDRVYQGMTLSFDFSFEEVFVPLMAGSTLVPSPGGLMLGADLWTFLSETGVTAMCCVPTLLASMSEDLPELRLILLGGEASPQDLIARWDRPGRLLLNTYGPTEATITATAGTLVADRPVTIGVPLPTYSIAILSPDEPELVPFGELGEICIAGIGLAVGYVNLPEKTDEKFIPDFLSLPNNPSGRIYRTGDLGRITTEGEVEYLGRIDTQVKLRGYRIELTEIESVLLEHPAIAQAVVDAIEISPGNKELVAYYTSKPGAAELDRSALFASLSQRLPSYMVPAFVEQLEQIPMLPSNKVNRKVLPQPVSDRLMAAIEDIRLPETELESLLVDALQESLQIPELSTESHFFESLGANSLGLARFSALVRERRPELRLSIRDCYLHPTVLALAAHLEEVAETRVPSRTTGELHLPSRWAYLATGAAQLAFTTAFAYAGVWLLVTVAVWLWAVYGTTAFYLRAGAVGVGLLAGSSVVAVASKWLLIGRFKPVTFDLWGLTYFRYWVARQLMGLSPLVAFKGTPLYNLYLRMLGANVSYGAVIEGTVPFATDLLSIGDHTVIQKDALIPGYRVENNRMTIGTVTIGERVYIGEGSVVDMDAVLEDDVQLGHASSVQSGQRLEAGRCYHGSPAVETETRYAKLDNDGSVVLRGFVYGMIFFLPAFVALPLALFVLVYVIEYFKFGPEIVMFVEMFSIEPLKMMPLFLALTSGLYLLGIVAAVIAILVWPRIYNLFVKPDKVYRLFGIRYFVFRMMRGLSNSVFLNTLFGDSSLITTYLKAIGYNLNQVIQTGSNFGTSQKHDSPFLCDIGTGTMVSDGLSMINTHQSSTSFQLQPSVLKEECFLGNDIRVPPESKVGRNCLLATKVLVPIDGPVREDVGLLGSPSFEIPRIVERDSNLLAQYSEEEKVSRIRRKNKSNLWTASLFLFSNWVFLSVAIALTIFGLYAYLTGGFLLWFCVSMSLLVYTVLHFTFAERMSIFFQRLQTGIFSIYDPSFWRIERYWKLSTTPLPSMFKGTPFRGFLWRLLGVRVGRMLFDDGAIITERTLVSLGDYCNLNNRVSLQSHSLEDGAFKCEPIEVGNGCNLAPGSFVHYGVQMEDHVTLESDSFLMKGERPTERSVWVGNPAQLS